MKDFDKSSFHDENMPKVNDLGHFNMDNNLQLEDEEIIAQNFEADLSGKNKSHESFDIRLDDPTYSKIDFEKHVLFFYSLPNRIAYNTVTIKNTGKTCVYFKWQKNNKPFNLEEKRNDGIDRFFCHYSDDKIFPEEEKQFTFSFFSEKNGVFSEDWQLITSPPLKNCDLNLHLNGLVHLYIDEYSQGISSFEQKVIKSASNTLINEFILDLIEATKESEPPRPDLRIEENFKFYFEILNKEFNVEFSEKVMKNLMRLNNLVMNDILGIVEVENKEEKEKESREEKKENEMELSKDKDKESQKSGKSSEKKKDKDKNSVKNSAKDGKEASQKSNQRKDSKKVVKNEESVELNPNILQTSSVVQEQAETLTAEEIREREEKERIRKENEEKKYWNGSIDELIGRINKVENEENRENYRNLLNCILHISRRKGVKSSKVYNFVREIWLDELENINETSNQIREEMNMVPYTFDLLTKQSLSEEDLAKYEADKKKAKEDYLKKIKKKALKPEEEQAQLEEYKNRLASALSARVCEKIERISQENVVNSLKENLLSAELLNEEYLDRLSRIKNFNSIKKEGGLDNKYVVLRIDIEECKRNYQDEVDEEGNVVGKTLKSIDFLGTKDTMFNSLSYLLNNGVRAVLLLVDFGPKYGEKKAEFSVKDLVPYIEKSLDHPTFYCADLEQLADYNAKIEEDELKDNCCIVLENLNFFEEECGLETETDPLVNPSQLRQPLSLYHKRDFLRKISDKTSIFVNDSIWSFERVFPTVVDMQVPLRILGNKVNEQLKKILEFFSIKNEEYVLIVGDNEVFKLRGKAISAKIHKSSKKDENNDKKSENQDQETAGFNVNNDNILDDVNVYGGVESLDLNEEECMISSLLTINVIMLRFKKIFIFGKLALQFIQFLRHDHTFLFDQKLFRVNERLFKLMKFIIVKAHLNNVEIVLPDDFKILDKEEFKKHLEPMMDSNGFNMNYTKEMKMLLKRERIQRRLEGAYTDPEELEENADYQRAKLEEEQIEHLKLYKEKTLKIEKMPYFYDFVKEFAKAQGIDKPRKIFKTPLEVYEFNEKIFDKEIIYPSEVLEASEFYVQKEKERKEKLEKEENEEEKKEGEEKEKEGKEAKEAKEKNGKKDNKGKEEESKKEENVNQKSANLNISLGPQGPQDQENLAESQVKNPQVSPQPPKAADPRLYDFDHKELVDFGEGSYQRLVDEISRSHGVMWLGRLSPSAAENVFDNYLRIVEAIQKRKKELKEKFEEDQATQEKKIGETETKARKMLLNIFLRNKHVYEVIKDTYKIIQSGANTDELLDEEEAPQDEEQFSHDMHLLIDYYIDDDFELINSILKGKKIAGFYGLSKEEQVEKEEEFDPHCIEEICN